MAFGTHRIARLYHLRQRHTVVAHAQLGGVRVVARITVGTGIFVDALLKLGADGIKPVTRPCRIAPMAIVAGRNGLKPQRLVVGNRIVFRRMAVGTFEIPVARMFKTRRVNDIVTGHLHRVELVRARRFGHFKMAAGMAFETFFVRSDGRRIYFIGRPSRDKRLDIASPFSYGKQKYRENDADKDE